MKDLLGFLFLVLLVTLVVYFAKLALRLARNEGPGDANKDVEAEPCPECGYDLRGGHRRCPECGIDVTPEALVARSEAGEFDTARLSGDWPADAIAPIQPGDGEVLADAFSTLDGWVAPLLQEQLMARGCWCRLEIVDKPVLSGSVVFTKRTYVLLVAEDERDRARTIVSRFRRAATVGVGDGAATDPE